MLNCVWSFGSLLVALSVPVLVSGCRSVESPRQKTSVQISLATNLLESARAEIAPDSHLSVYRLGIEPRGSQLVLTGDVDSVQARVQTLQRFKAAGIPLVDETVVLPASGLGDATWGVCNISTGAGREKPSHTAEMGTQLLMGEVVRIFKRVDDSYLSWYLVQSSDGYICWLPPENVVRCTREQADAWTSKPLLMVTQFEAQVRSEPRADSDPVCDLVLLDLVEKVGEAPGWLRIRLPDDREGYMEAGAAQDWRSWKASRKASAENIERSARQFVGRPYLWGANSPRGLDCSGFTKVVFALNGIDLMRNASQQARQGLEVSLGNDFADLKKGDLLFFGRRAQYGQPEKITHVGIYLGNKIFIHSADMVKISSLDPISPNGDAKHSSRLLHARRILSE